MENLIPLERIVGQIYLLCGVKVMLDCDLADLYGGGAHQGPQAGGQTQNLPLFR